MALPADDDVVMNGHAQGLAGIDDLSGHIDVGARWRGISGGMVVHQPDEQ